MKPVFGIIIAAGGASSRFGSNKLLEQLDGLPVFCHCLCTFAQCDNARIVMAAPQANIPEYRAVIQQYLPECAAQIELVAGGANRTQSVYNAILALTANADARPELLAVHDAARPYASRALLQRCIDALLADATLDGAIAVHAVTDTIHQVDEHGVFCTTHPRATLRAAETPQVFRTDVLLRAYATLNSADVADMPTDEAQLVMRLPHARVIPIDNCTPNPKITYRYDLVR